MTKPVLASLAAGVLGPDSNPEVAQGMLDTIALIASEADRRQLHMTFKALDTRLGALVLSGRPRPVSTLRPEKAERLLQKWQRSPFPIKRRLAGAVITLALASNYSDPREYSSIGYAGPLGEAPDQPKRLQPLEVTEDTTIQCDVVVVGSGAGGGCVAGRLAESGFDVVILEMGGYRSESDFHHRELDATRELYLYGMTLATSDLGCRILAGSTVGGGTVVNYTTSFPAPKSLLDEWTRISGIDAFASGELEDSTAEASKRLGVNTDSGTAGKRDELMAEGLRQLGWHVDAMPRNVVGCSQDAQCGYCGFGCRVGAKQSSMRTYLQDAAQAGAKIVTGAQVDVVTIANGRATGVQARVGRHSLTIGAKAVVVAGGSIESPALLLRSGLGGRVGYNLHLHPATAAFGIFDEDVRMWEGTTQARYSNELKGPDNPYGPIFETVPVHPGAGSTALPWVSANQHRKLMDQYPKISLVAALPRDEASGRVKIGKDGRPRIDYKLGQDDERRLGDGVVAAGKVLEAAGAKEIFSAHPSFIHYKTGKPADHQDWAERTRRAGYTGGRVTLFSYHQMGSCAMGIDPSSSVVDGNNESHEVKGLFVADASNFPTASGVNPMLTIYGIANRAAGRIAKLIA